jgi:hypothetical protein
MVRRSWMGGSTLLWTQGYGSPDALRRAFETLRDVAFASGLVTLAGGSLFFLLG